MAKFTPKRNSRPDQIYQVKITMPLLQYLMQQLNGRSRTTVKSYLSHRQISVNGKTETAFDLMLHPGDTVTLKAVGEHRLNPNNKIRIVYEDAHLIIVDKKNGVDTISKDSGEQTAFSIVSGHLRHYRQNNRLFVVHRLDRDASGLIIFARSEEMQDILQRNWNDSFISRTYVAVIEGKINPENGNITSWLTENAKSLKMETSSQNNNGVKATTYYRMLKDNGLYSLVELDMKTCHKHQARVQLSSIGHPIAGDKKYGARTNPLGRLCLHARALSFVHPATGERISFDTGIPSVFR